MVTKAEGPGWTLYLGRWQDTPLADLEPDAVLTDPPFGERTHGGQRHGRKEARYTKDATTACLAGSGFAYDHWTDEDVVEFVEHWSPRTSGWIGAMTSHDLVPVYSTAMEAAGRYVFAPISCVQHARNIRLAGDGPANWTDHLVVSRPRDGAWLSARKVRRERAGLNTSLPGAYVGPSHDIGENSLDRSKRITGGKPLWLMRAIIRDYTRPGDLVVDPCAGGATTLLAAVIEGRRAIGAEMDPDTFALAKARLERGYTPTFDFGEAS